MRFPRQPLRCAATATALLLAPAILAAPASATSTAAPRRAGPAANPRLARSGALGGARAPGAPQAGGSEYGVVRGAAASHPLLRTLRVPSTAPAGRPPRISFRVEESRVETVKIWVTVTDLHLNTAALSIGLGWVHTGRNLSVTWHAGAALAPGSYRVSISGRDHHFERLTGTAHASGAATLTVVGSVPSTPPPGTVTAPELGVLTPAESAADGAVFPVAGAHSFGGPDNRFGAPRSGYVHEGQDVLTAEGTPVLAPLAGTILTTAYQAAGAGYYAVEHTSVGFDFMFAHCKAQSLAVSTGALVAAGQQLCQAGQSGDARGSHLHFEMWVGGWRAPTGHPIDPLPYLQAWDHSGS